MTGSKNEDLKRTNFGVMLSTLVDVMMIPPPLGRFGSLSDNSLNTMKEILRGQSDPSDPSKLLIPLEVYEKANDIRELIYSLVPRYINYRNTSLLHSLVAKTKSQHLHYVTDYENDPTGDVLTPKSKKVNRY